MRELERHSSNNQTRIPALAIVGPGRLGRALARASADAGIDAQLAGRSDAATACEQAEVALLCVPDEAIEGACARVSVAVPPLRYVGHTSGATPLAALGQARRAGAETFSLHPLQTVPDSTAGVDGSHCAIAGSSPDAERLAGALAEALGMRPFTVPEQSRAAYHAAASIASNFLVALEESAVELLDAAGIEDGRELLAPLVARTAENWSRRGSAALTGPIARGDEATVNAHLEAIAAAAPRFLELYEAMAERTRSIAAGDRGRTAAPKPEVVA